MHHSYTSYHLYPPSTYNFEELDTLNYSAYVDLKNNSILFGASFNHPQIVPYFSVDPFSPWLDSSLQIISGVTTWSDGANIQSAYAHWSGNSNFLPPMTAISLQWMPILVSPKKASLNLRPEYVELLWDSIKYMNSYHLQIYRDSVSGMTFIDTIISLTNITLSSFSKNTKYFWRVAGVNDEGQSRWSEIWSFTTSSESNVMSRAQRVLPSSIYPNPASKGLNISYLLPPNEGVRITLYDLQGRVIQEVLQNADPDRHFVKLDVSNLPNGTYIAGIITKEDRKTFTVEVIH
jgi:hypothetical protein